MSFPCKGLPVLLSTKFENEAHSDYEYISEHVNVSYQLFVHNSFLITRAFIPPWHIILIYSQITKTFKEQQLNHNAGSRFSSLLNYSDKSILVHAPYHATCLSPRLCVIITPGAIRLHVTFFFLMMWYPIQTVSAPGPVSWAKHLFWIYLIHVLSLLKIIY